jgi:cytochrome P450
LVTAAAAFLFLLAASSATYRFCVAAVVSRLLKLKTRNNSNQHRHHQDSDISAQPPAPPGRGSGWWWCAVETLAFVAANGSGRGFYHFVAERHRRHGPPCFRTPLFGATHVFVSSHAAARSLLAAEPAGFSKRYVRTVADLLGEHSLLCADHAAHRSLRRAVAPLFNARATASFATAFDALTRRLMRDWLALATCLSPSSSSSVVVLDAALEMTFDAICDMLVSTLPRDAKRRLQGDVMAVTQAMLAFPLRLPGTRFHAGLRARERIMEVLRREIASRRQRGHGGGRGGDMDFLQSLLLRSQQQSENDGEALLTDEQILDNILTLIIAGMFST